MPRLAGKTALITGAARGIAAPRATTIWTSATKPTGTASPPPCAMNSARWTSSSTRPASSGSRQRRGAGASKSPLSNVKLDAG